MPAAAVMGDVITSTDIHTIMIPTPGGPVPTPLPHPYAAPIASNCSTNVMIGGRAAAVVGSQSSFVHIPQGGPFQVPPTGIGQITMGSATVKINGKPAARTTDMVITCTEGPPAAMISTPGVPTVMIGG